MEKRDIKAFFVIINGSQSERLGSEERRFSTEVLAFDDDYMSHTNNVHVKIHMTWTYSLVAIDAAE